MNWVRKHTNKDYKHCREWRAGRGKYRVIWRDQVFSVTVPAGYQSCVRIYIPETGESMWDFVDRNRRPLYRTLRAAKTACEKHANSNYKPEIEQQNKSKIKQQNKFKRKAPMKVCPQCDAKVHVRRATCDCDYLFPKKVKREAIKA